MLSGEGNENGEKTTIGPISKKATFQVEQGCSALNFFAAVLHDYNVKLQETFWLRTFSGGNVVRSFSTWCLLTCLIFSPPLQIFHVVLPAKNVFCFFISRSSSLSLFFSLSFAGLSPPFLFSLSFSFSIFQICEHDN